ncbi:MAG: DUF2993 domain-containing protein [Elainellaceae cyanobacterium]
MEVFTVLLSTLIGLLSPVGLITDAALEDAIEDQLHDAEFLEVRVDNRPSYDLLSGKVDRIRVAGRGVYPIPELRVALLDLETDPVDLRFGRLTQGQVSLQDPLQFVTRVVIDVEDINDALRSPAVTEVLQDIGINALGSTVGQIQQADLIEPRLDLEDSRIRLTGTLQEQGTDDELAIAVEFDLGLEQGHQFTIQDPRLVANGAEFPSELLLPLVQGLNQQLTLRNLEPLGITARLLELDIGPEGIEAIAFVRAESSVFP